MTFAIETPTKAKLEDVRVLSQKNRQPDENPGVQLPLSVKLSNHALSSFDGSLKSFLFTKNGADVPTATKRKDNSTGTLDGVEPVSDLPNLSPIGAKVKAIKWDDEVTGGVLTVAFATSKIEIDDCTARAFRIQPQEGGTVQLKFIVEAPDASEKVFAKLAKFKSREVEISFVQHEPAQQDIERAPAAAAKTAPKGGKQEPEGAWPFPKNKDQQTPEKALAQALGVAQ
jgi:hypothetical protein